MIYKPYNILSFINFWEKLDLVLQITVKWRSAAQLPIPGKKLRNQETLALNQLTQTQTPHTTHQNARAPRDPKINKQKNYNMPTGPAAGPSPANIANPPPAPAHTHAAPPPPPATGTQAPTQPPGIQNRRESWMARCSPQPHTPRSSQNNQHNRKPTSAPLSPD